MAAPLVLSPYPLATDDRRFLEQSLGAQPVSLTVGELRRLRPSQMLRLLRSSGGDLCVLAIPDVAGLALRPLLHTIAAVAGFRRIDVVGPDRRRVRVPRRHAPISAAAVLAGTIDNAKAVRVAQRELAALAVKSRLDLRLGDRPEVLYLNANLSLGLQVGGSVGHMAGVANALASAGHPVELASIALPPTLNGGVRAVRLFPPATLAPPFENNSYRFSRSVVVQLLPWVSSDAPRFVYQRLTVANYSGVVLSRLARTPLVIEYNGSEAWSARHWGTPLRYHGLAIAAEDVCLKHAHIVVTVSDVLRDELERRGVAPERIVWYPNCVDSEFFDADRIPVSELAELRAGLGIPDDAVVVTFVGTFGRWHGVDVLARAIKRMTGSDREWLVRNRVRFLLVGDGLLASEVDATLSSDPTNDQFVVRTGLVPQERVPAFLAISDVVVSPHVPNPDGSRFFGSPTKLFEYMSAGKAIVASDLEQIGEVLVPSIRASQLPTADAESTASEVAVLAAPGDIDELTRGIRFLVEHPDWRRLLGANARSRAAERYTWSHHVAAILERLNTVVPARLPLSGP